MKFNIKDVKSWANRHDVNVGDKGYFTHSINWLKDDFELNVDTIACIRDDFGNCFVSEKCSNEGNSFPFFIPLKVVKGDKPKEKKYRPFKTISELECDLNKDNRSAHQFLSVGNDIFIRNKNNNQLTHLIITRIDRDAETSEVINVNGMPPIYLFNNYEIRIGAEWLPFGVEVEND